MYRFYELTCPNCGHKFNWIVGTYKIPVYKLYRLVGHKEILNSTVCPICNIEMVVLKNSCSGIDINDKRI